MIRLRRLASKYYRELFECASEAIWIHDLDGKIIAANRAAEELIGDGHCGGVLILAMVN